MPKLKLSVILNDKPVKVTIELPAKLHRDLVAYAQALGGETGSPITDPKRLIAPMLERFIATDRGFAKARRLVRPSSQGEALQQSGQSSAQD
ncbi:DUF2274 domain-containing protein [Xanthobacter wiegelii]|uniref:DUF2274 domain-containing protein n=1 Tax=Xanthobacter wiegelii TaxID=3119913 RepID=UPI0037299C9A